MGVVTAPPRSLLSRDGVDVMSPGPGTMIMSALERRNRPAVRLGYRCCEIDAALFEEIACEVEWFVTSQHTNLLRSSEGETFLALALGPHQL